VSGLLATIGCVKISHYPPYSKGADVKLVEYLYIQMDGTQVFVVKSETEGRAGRTLGATGAHSRM